VSVRDDFIDAQTRLLDKVGVRARSRFVELDAVDGPVHVLSHGSGPPVVLVPGFADPAAMWAPLLAELEGFTTFAVDRPCFGLSGTAPLRTETLRSLAVSFLSQLLDALELEDARFIGNSIGSQWIFWFAAAEPERARALVHIGCPACLLGTSAPLPMRLLSIRPLGRLLLSLTPPTPHSVERFAAAVPKEDLSGWPELCELLAVMQQRPGVRSALRAQVAAIVGLGGPRKEVELDADLLREVPQPNLLVWGANDPFGPVDVGRHATELLPDAAFEVIDGAGHAPWINHAAQVGDLVRPFLQTATRD
jgi:pimeloyl-ACP methyl ester carboxylesterase